MHIVQIDSLFFPSIARPFMDDFRHSFPLSGLNLNLHRKILPGNFPEVIQKKTVLESKSLTGRLPESELKKMS
jgi:hypothetical protein